MSTIDIDDFDTADKGLDGKSASVSVSCLAGGWGISEDGTPNMVDICVNGESAHLSFKETRRLIDAILAAIQCWEEYNDEDVMG